MDGTDPSLPSGVSLIVPAFNEADGIAEMIAKADEAMATVVDDYEIIVVDDGSTDSTFDIATQACQHRPRVRVLRYDQNRGYGAAIRTGFEAAQKDLLAFTDADCQFELRELPRFTLLSADYDLVCGYRIDRQDTWMRKTYSKVYNVLVRTLLGTQVRDIDCAFKMFHRRDRERLAITTDGFLVNTELLTQAKQHGLSVVEVGVTHLPRVRGQSTVSAAHIPQVLSGLLRFWWNRGMFAGSDNSVEDRAPRSNAWRWGFPLVALLAALLLFTNLGYPLIDRDETRYAEIPREMLVTGNWIAPQLNFEPYYDKPPLFYWLCAASFRTLGISEWSARLVPATAAFLLILSTMWFGGRIFSPRIGVLGGLVLLSTVGFMFGGRFLIIDGLLSLLVALSCFACFEAIRGGVFKWRWWIVSAACCGLGVLAKGPVAGVLLGPPTLVFAWLTASSARIRMHHWLAFAAIVAGVAGLWFATAASHDPRFFYEFIVKHNISRFAGAYHRQPFWYFIPVALIGGHPWTCLLIPYAQFLARRSREAAAMRTPAQAFLLLWVAWCVFFFSLSKGKLPTYILPAAPAFALLVAHYLDHAIFRSPRYELFAMARRLSPWLAVAATCTAGVGLATVGRVMQLNSNAVVAASVLGWLALGVCLIVVYQKTSDQRTSWSLCCGLALLLALQGTQVVLPRLGGSPALVMPSPELAKWAADEQLRVATFAHEWSGVPFYSRRNDIKNFAATESRELSEFVAAQPRTVIVVLGKGFADHLTSLLPPDLKVTLLEASGDTCVLLAEHGPNFRVAARVAMPAKR